MGNAALSCVVAKLCGKGFYFVQCRMYEVRCTFYIVHCTLYKILRCCCCNFSYFVLLMGCHGEEELRRRSHPYTTVMLRLSKHHLTILCHAEALEASLHGCHAEALEASRGIFVML